jgi:hypothetical protein
MHQQDPTQGKPLISSLSEINPVRPKNWLLYGVAGVELPAQTLHQRAWRLAGRLHAWGEDLSLSDQPFPDGEIKNAELVQAIFQDPQLAGAEQMIGRYLLRQLVLLQERSLLLDVLPPRIATDFPDLFMPIVVQEAFLRARQRDLDHIQSLVARFPLLQQEGILAIALRRVGQFEAAASELRNCQHEPPGERELLQARIADAFVLSLPNNPDEQRRMREQLEPLLETDYKADSEIGYCKFLAGILVGDPVVAEQSYLWLRNLVKANCSGRAYRLLAAVQSRNPRYIQEALSAVESSEAAELFRSMPTNLLKAGIGALADYPDPSALRGLTDFIHTQAQELLDALTAREDWLLADPNVRQRWMAKLQAGDSVTKWKGYQQVIEVASQCGDSQLQAQAVEACLSLQDPSLAPQQAEMLQQRIYSCDNMGLREHLIERLVAIRPDQAQPHLWQLLQVYLGQQRQRDAARIVKLLKDIGENGPTLTDCAKANGNHRSH